MLARLVLAPELIARMFREGMRETRVVENPLPDDARIVDAEVRNNELRLTLTAKRFPVTNHARDGRYPLLPEPIFHFVAPSNGEAVASPRPLSATTDDAPGAAWVLILRGDAPRTYLVSGLQAMRRALEQEFFSGPLDAHSQEQADGRWAMFLDEANWSEGRFHEDGEDYTLTIFRLDALRSAAESVGAALPEDSAAADAAAEPQKSLEQWVEDRLVNTLRIVETKAGGDRKRWLQVAFRFRHILAALRRSGHLDELDDVDSVHGPQDCPRRCIDCADGGHHWYPAFADDDEDEGNCEPMAGSNAAHPAVTEHQLDAWFSCKHCEAWTTCEYAELVLGVEA